MNREEFEQAYAMRSKISLEKLKKFGQRGYPCNCGDESCDGWQMTSRENAEVQVRLGLMDKKALELHDHDNRLVVEYCGYQIEAFRGDSLAGYDYIYHCILRKSDGYVVVDAFDGSDDMVTEFVDGVMKPMVDDIIKNPLDYYDSEEDLLEAEPLDGVSPGTAL